MIDLRLGDCREWLATLPQVDAVVTDPPYGIRMARSRRMVVERGFAVSAWDDAPISQEDIDLVRSKGKAVVIWGGNYYYLPPTRGFLIWDKKNDGRDFAECEFAWTNVDSVARMFRMRPQNMDGGKVHPTQKPLALMEWIVARITNPGDTVLDPFMGSGTTGVACVKLGRNFIGGEIDPTHYATAQRRIADAQAQLALPV